MSDFLKDSWLTTIFTGKTTAGDKVSSTTMNVTKIVSFFVTLFAGLTQIIKLTQDKFPITAGQMVLIWLVVATLVVLLGITDMVTRAYVTAHGKTNDELETDLRALNLGTFQVDDTPGVDAHARQAEVIGVLRHDGKRYAHVDVTDGAAKFDEYVLPNRLHR